MSKKDFQGGSLDSIGRLDPAYRLGQDPDDGGLFSAKRGLFGSGKVCESMIFFVTGRSTVVDGPLDSGTLTTSCSGSLGSGGMTAGGALEESGGLFATFASASSSTGCCST